MFRSTQEPSVHLTVPIIFFKGKGWKWRREGEHGWVGLEETVSTRGKHVAGECRSLIVYKHFILADLGKIHSPGNIVVTCHYLGVNVMPGKEGFTAIKNVNSKPITRPLVTILHSFLYIPLLSLAQ